MPMKQVFQVCNKTVCIAYIWQLLKLLLTCVQTSLNQYTATTLPTYPMSYSKNKFLRL